MAQYWIPGVPEESLWLDMEGIEVWAGDLVEIAILVQGTPGAEFHIEAFELLSGSPVDRIRAFFSDWNAFLPWGTASINKFEATRSSHASIFPVPLAAILLVVSLLAARAGVWPRMLSYIGIAVAVLYWLVVVANVFGIWFLISIVAGLGGVILAPIWYIWVGLLLRRTGE